MDALNLEDRGHAFHYDLRRFHPFEAFARSDFAKLTFLPQKTRAIEIGLKSLLEPQIQSRHSEYTLAALFYVPPNWLDDYILKMTFDISISLNPSFNPVGFYLGLA